VAVGPVILTEKVALFTVTGRISVLELLTICVLVIVIEPFWIAALLLNFNLATVIVPLVAGPLPGLIAPNLMTIAPLPLAATGPSTRI
jgi:hypothetical protein